MPRKCISVLEHSLSLLEQGRLVKVHWLSEELETLLASTESRLVAEEAVEFGAVPLGQIPMEPAAAVLDRLLLGCVSQDKRLMDSKTPMRLALEAEAEALVRLLRARAVEQGSRQASQGRVFLTELVGLVATAPPMEPQILELEAEERVPILGLRALAVRES